MCNNRAYTPEEQTRLDWLSKLSRTVLSSQTKTSVPKVAEKMGISPKDVMDGIVEIGKVNLPLRKQLEKALGIH